MVTLVRTSTAARSMTRCYCEDEAKARKKLNSYLPTTGNAVHCYYCPNCTVSLNPMILARGRFLRLPEGSHHIDLRCTLFDP